MINCCLCKIDLAHIKYVSLGLFDAQIFVVVHVTCDAHLAQNRYNLFCIVNKDLFHKQS